MLSFGTQTKREKKTAIFTIKLIEYGVKLKWHFIFLGCAFNFIAQAKRHRMYDQEIATKKGQTFY